MKRIVSILMMAVVLSLSGCCKNDIVKTYNPETGLVLLIVDPPELEEGEELPTSYFIEVNGVKDEIVDGQITFASLVELGTYNVRIYNETNAIKVDSDGVAATEVNGDYAELSDEHLYFGEGVMTISADSNGIIEVEVEPMTKKLVFEMLITEGDIDKIDNIYMTFSGVASGWHCINGETVGDATSVESSFEVAQMSRSGVTSADGYYLTSSLRLLGMVGYQHELNIEVTYTNGHKQVISSNLEGLLNDFNDDKTSAKYFQSSTSLLSETEYTATIVDWEESTTSLEFEIGPAI